ncbi:OTU domain-containing protein 3-like [Clavelina lepadiformis]|uniref:OTU domain-containing protein 3-like n=1 Tax=Clavelina lepadiformis TaxID=159417 RepID=UPI00404262F7
MSGWDASRKNDQSKREERAVRKAHQNMRRQKELARSYFLDDENFAGFSNQLGTIGLKLRDIPGDGNCLFRALGDQLEGHSRNHQIHREETVKFMVENRSDFEPFLEDDCSFHDYVGKLRLDGTYAGNDAIVAFARNHGVNVVIHQLNAPMWTVNGADRGKVPQLHIAYHNGDHYSSIRKLSDNSENPAAVKLMTRSENKQGSMKRESKRNQLSPSGSKKKQIQQVANVTGCQDLKLIQETLEDNFYDVDQVIGIILQLMHYSSDEDSSNKPHSSTSNKSPPQSQIWDKNGSGSRIFGSHNVKTETKKKTTQTPKHMSNKNRKEQARKDRKKRSEERKRNAASSNHTSDSEESEIVIKNLNILTI